MKFLFEHEILVQANNFSELTKGTIIRRIGKTIDQQRIFLGEDEAGGIIL